MLIDTNSLYVTHVFVGEEVVSGGDDGQNWVATFASRTLADRFVAWARETFKSIKAADVDDRMFVYKRLVTHTAAEIENLSGRRELKRAPRTSMTPEEEVLLLAERQWNCKHAMMQTQCAHCGITKAEKEEQDALKAADPHPTWMIP